MTARRFIDGSPIPVGYLERLSALADDVCLAEEKFGVDELEAYASSLSDADEEEKETC